MATVGQIESFEGRQKYAEAARLLNGVRGADVQGLFRRVPQGTSLKEVANYAKVLLTGDVVPLNDVGRLRELVSSVCCGKIVLANLTGEYPETTVAGDGVLVSDASRHQFF